jgi:Ni,Fe-hydrogenase I cytochrome b subunit
MDEKEFRDLKTQVDDTHRMVAKLYKFEKNRRFWRALKIIILAVIIVGAYYAILPVFNRVLDTYNNFSNGVTNIQNFQFPWQKDGAGEVQP